MKDETPPMKPATILVPRGFQNRQLVKPTDPEHPEYGECLTCKGTGAQVLGVQLLEPKIVDGRIVECKPTLQLIKCKCALGQFWVNFHHLNVQAKVIPKWYKEIKEFTEQEKARLIRESGGNYNPHNDTFLNRLGYQNPSKKPKLVSVDDAVKQLLRKDGVIE